MVLQWLMKSQRHLKTFVANRVAYIHEHTHENGIPWHWVPGKENPADIASRGQNPSQLANCNLWWHGPSWLAKSEEHWPPTFEPPLKDSAEVAQEVHSACANEENLRTIRSGRMPNSAVCSVATFKPPPKWTIKKHTIKADLFKAYSNFKTLWHVIGYVIRAAHNFKQQSRRKYDISALTDEELEKARLMIVRDHQSKYYKNDIKILSRPNSLQKLNRDDSLWFDQNTKTLRFYGRVTTNNLTFDEKFPIIIAANSTLAKLLLKHAHTEVGHGGAQQMLQYIRKRYWICKARQTAQTIIRGCKNCFRHNLVTAETLMATLPAERTTPQRPFRECGVDYMGPVNIASRRGRAPPITKGYVCVFVCFVTRAIHLELVSDGTKEMFLQALRRMTSRRGAIKTMWSDNGTTFVGENNYLKEIATRHGQWATEIEHDFHMKWKFIVPRAPSWGGI